MKVAAVKAGLRPPFPLVLHVHAVLMGSFLLLLLAQSVMMATGRCALHKQVGIAAFVLVPALVVVGIILAPTIYHQVWGGAHFGPPAVRAALTPVAPQLENILLLQIHAGILFARVHDHGPDGAGGEQRVPQEDDLPGDRGAAGGVDRPHGLVAEHVSGEPDVERRVHPAGGGADVRVGRDPEPPGA